MITPMDPNITPQQPDEKLNSCISLFTVESAKVLVSINEKSDKMSKISRIFRSSVVARIFDLLICILLLAFLSLSSTGYIRPRGAGFFCNDQSISHKFKGDTVKASYLLLGSFLGPLLFIIPVELIHLINVKSSSTFTKSLKKLLLNVWRKWKILLIGLLITLTLTEVAKSIVSEPRPHFWYTCKPNVTETQCKDGYITNFTCTSTFPPAAIIDAQKSFPSGHASLSVFASSFMIWYFQSFILWRKSFTLVPCLHLIWTAFALTSSLTRITDRRHHWWDVLAGAALGIAVCLVVTRAQKVDRRKSSQVCDEAALVSEKQQPESTGLMNLQAESNLIENNYVK